MIKTTLNSIKTEKIIMTIMGFLMLFMLSCSYSKKTAIKFRPMNKLLLTNFKISTIWKYPS